MSSIATILCPIDYSDHSRSALRHARALARLYGARLIVLHVYPGSRTTAQLPSFTRAGVLHDLRRWVDGESSADVPVEIDVREGDPASEIPIAAAAAGADLLVLGTHGRGGFQHLLLGSVTEKVLRTAGCPVLTVPRHAASEGTEAPVAYSRILCPVDFSEPSRDGLRYAASLARESGARLTVLHVMVYEMEPTPDMHDSLIAEGRLTLAAFRQAYEARSRLGLEEAIREAAPDASGIETALATGTPWREIVRMAGDAGSDLIVMGVHGRGAVSQRFVGSTTNHVVRQVACPVLTLRALIP